MIDALLARVNRCGAQLSRRGDKLHVEAPAPLPGDLMDLLRAYKPEILRLLAQAERPQVPEWEVTIRRWLAAIEEEDPEYVVDRCRNDLKARTYFLSHACRWVRQEKVKGLLAKNHDLRLAVVVDDEGERFIATVAVRGQGVVDLAIDRAKYDGIKLLELVGRYGGTWPKMEAAA